MLNIAIINGPNLNLLGKRETSIYGHRDFESFLKDLNQDYPNINFNYFQSNIEGEIINQLQTCGYSYDGIILNAAAYTHTSVGIGDTVKAIKTPVIEVHISNIWTREPYRHQSYISPCVIGVIAGFGLDSYRLAVEHLIKIAS